MLKRLKKILPGRKLDLSRTLSSFNLTLDQFQGVRKLPGSDLTTYSCVEMVNGRTISKLEFTPLPDDRKVIQVEGFFQLDEDSTDWFAYQVSHQELMAALGQQQLG